MKLDKYEEEVLAAFESESLLSIAITYKRANHVRFLLPLLETRSVLRAIFCFRHDMEEDYMPDFEPDTVENPAFYIDIFARATIDMRPEISQILLEYIKDGVS